MTIQIVNNSNNPLPKYNNEPINGNVRDSGLDVYADFSKINKKFLFDSELIENASKIVIKPLGRVLIPTGIHCSIPPGYEIQVRDRSGNALKRGLIVTNGVGTIDSSYTGDIGVILTNCSNQNVIIEDHERIAQLVCMRVIAVEWEQVETLEETVRGAKGFGDSGTK